MKYTWDKWVKQADKLSKAHKPFFFLIDYEKKEPHLFTMESLPGNLMVNFPGFKWEKSQPAISDHFIFEKFPIQFHEYKTAFDQVKKHLNRGDSFLLNLSFPSKILTNYSLEDLYHITAARYKIYFQDWVVFTPEPFIRIQDNRIYSYPMKGTIDAGLEDAENILLSDPKEHAEHNTIVDLIRNDLSQVAKNVRVNRFKYLDRINTHRGAILQMSSEITGQIKPDLRNRIGSIMNLLLPAGSISGAPKKKTTQIIKETEFDERGFYTGIGGFYDGHKLDSCVLIRYVEHKKGEFYFRSGGGLTYQSKAQTEYDELLNKIYLPLRRDHQDRKRQSQEYTLS